jgi:hypothetical protein
MNRIIGRSVAPGNAPGIEGGVNPRLRPWSGLRAEANRFDDRPPEIEFHAKRSAQLETVLKLCPGRGAITALPVELPSWELPTAIASCHRRELSSVGELFRHQTRELSAKLA